ncbi:carbohydrate esterase [Thiospirochaeta perfilievii]|uniref:Carbohydrate esterase n=1 Tax=Thiospirochaeta perfilievii TaxID=252967 RepID=A0A5C1Q8A3_9SPIO|nr:SGNH/GDSL hydrolase family protein [Thiospirochaeta perfilievii]QEN04313.1 carbohydrate esterase [Thiospirochaeta perfilievii]
MRGRSTLYIVGDSTLCSFEDKDYFIPRSGYGTKIHKYADSDNLEIVNLALSGRSSKSFINEENYITLLKNIKKGDYLLIDFSHNDEKPDITRYTDPTLPITHNGSFKNILDKYYINIALNSKAFPILVTPIVRRGELNSHISKGTSQFRGGDYPKAIRELGHMLNIPVIDMTKITKNLYDCLGDAETYNLHANKYNNPESIDNTHINSKGADVIAYLLCKSIKENYPPLGQYLLEKEVVDGLDREIF